MNAQDDNTAPSRTGMRRIIPRLSSVTCMPWRGCALALVPFWSASASLRSWEVPSQRRLSGGQRSGWCWPRRSSRSATGTWLSSAPHLPEPEPAPLALVLVWSVLDELADSLLAQELASAVRPGRVA